MRTGRGQRGLGHDSLKCGHSTFIAQHSVLCAAVCALLFALCASAEAQQPPSARRIGVLVTGPFFWARFAALREALRELGYMEGKNLVFEYRDAQGNVDRFPRLAAELVREKVDLIYTA